MEITVVTLVKEQMSPWKGNLPRSKWGHLLRTPKSLPWGFKTWLLSTLGTLIIPLDQTWNSIDDLEVNMKV
ncbi:hypothetical protein Tco_1569518 [Tanacetum coccineum]